MGFLAKDVALDPVPVFHGLIADGTRRTRNHADRDRRADLDCRPPGRAPAPSEVAAIFRGSDGSAARRSNDMARRETRPGPACLVDNFVVMMFRRAMTRVRCRCERRSCEAEDQEND